MTSAADIRIQGLESHWEPKCPFDLVVVYEDTTTRNRALTLYDHLAQRLLDECDFRCAWWKLGQLQKPVFREQAADAAALANMIILSLRAGSWLPESVRYWLDSWLPRKTTEHKSALVTLIAGLPPENQQVCPVQVCLEKLARAANMDFFAHRFDEPGLERPRSSGLLDPKSLMQRAQTVTPFMIEILERKHPSPRWGLNE